MQGHQAVQWEDRVPGGHNRPVDRVRGYLAAGTPEQVVEQVGEYLEAGLDGLVFNMIQAHEIEPVAVAGEALTKAFG